MRQDVDQSSEWIPHLEPPDAPRLSHRAVLDLESRSRRSLVNLIDVVDLDRDVQYGSPRPHSAAMLICGVVCVSVAKSGDRPDIRCDSLPRHHSGTSYSGDGAELTRRQ